MIIQRNDEIRLENWMSCIIEVSEVGPFSIKGILRDIRTEEIICPSLIVPRNQNWIKVKKIEDILRQ